jgi:hypothetical protein
VRGQETEREKRRRIKRRRGEEVSERERMNWRMVFQVRLDGR